MDLDLLDKPAMERIRIVKYKERIGQASDTILTS